MYKHTTYCKLAKKTYYKLSVRVLQTYCKPILNLLRAYYEPIINHEQTDDKPTINLAEALVKILL